MTALYTYNYITTFTFNHFNERCFNINITALMFIVIFYLAMAHASPRHHVFSTTKPGE